MILQLHQVLLGQKYLPLNGHRAFLPLKMAAHVFSQSASNFWPRLSSIIYTAKKSAFLTTGLSMAHLWFCKSHYKFKFHRITPMKLTQFSVEYYFMKALTTSQVSNWYQFYHRSKFKVSINYRCPLRLLYLSLIGMLNEQHQQYHSPRSREAFKEI